ncbi:hypothetical protein PoB_003360000 [Plakobranchus ocellatus]|uniref:Uncharacterized protein n=1 Tax=Plakobranchus ocellatus TaxID=259542 RepID=A0AAV4AJU3_9GAST|nr:hypothetical protein PoB_003360000 [Plakobranchus ocellatus]
MAGDGWFFFLYKGSQQQGDLTLLGPPSGQSAGGGARTRDRRVPADVMVDLLSTVPPTPPIEGDDTQVYHSTIETKANHRHSNHRVSAVHSRGFDRGW